MVSADLGLLIGNISDASNVACKRTAPFLNPSSFPKPFSLSYITYLISLLHVTKCKTRATVSRIECSSTSSRQAFASFLRQNLELHTNQIIGQNANTNWCGNCFVNHMQYSRLDLIRKAFKICLEASYLKQNG